MAEPATSTVDAGPGGDTGNVKNGRTTSAGNADASVTVVKKDGGTVVVDADVMEDADLPDVIDIIDTGVIDAGCVQNPPPPPADTWRPLQLSGAAPCATSPAGPISWMLEVPAQGEAGPARSIRRRSAAVTPGSAAVTRRGCSSATRARRGGGRRTGAPTRTTDPRRDRSATSRSPPASSQAASVWSFERHGRVELEARRASVARCGAAGNAWATRRRAPKTTQALAARFGARGAEPRVTDGEVRAIEAIALENLIEGCVRETYGALIATRQAKRRVIGGATRDAEDRGR
ncbi:MAG: hypothetical protein U0235_30685 [Polyangiaceae bacterium]